MSIQTNILPNNPQIEVIKSGKTGLFTNYIYKAIPLAFDESMSYYETLLGLLHYLKNVILPTVNNNADAVAELQTLYEELRAYVRDYFKGLDVQEEINNKLDEMVEDGTLPEIVASYLNSKAIFGFDNVESMKNSSNLINGSYAKTLGFYEKNDGGGALYKIRQITTIDIIDNASIIPLTDNLIAEIILNDSVNVLQFGAKPDNTTNNTDILQIASNYATKNNLVFYVPNGNYKTNTFTLENIKEIKIDGNINFITNTDNLNVYENVNNETPNIYINKVTIGTIVMKGLNSSNIKIQNAHKLILLADNTTGHGFIGYNTFNLGYIRYLELNDDGSGSKWINENLFIGGRFLGITIGGENSTYEHQNNLFFKPMCENTVININKGKGNRIIDARLEGSNTSITFGETTFGNVITSNYAETKNGYMNPKYFYRSKNFVTDNSGGKNKFINNEDLNEHVVLSINKFNNPKELTASGDNIIANSGDTFFESDFISLPNIDVQLFIYSSNKNVAWRIECYDENFNKLTSNPNLIIDPTTIGYTSAGTYGNVTYSRNDYWGLLDSTKTDVKYIKIGLYCPSALGLSNEPYKNIDMYLTYYGNLDNLGYYLKAFGTSI